MTGKQKKMFYRIILAGLAYIALIILEHTVAAEFMQIFPAGLIVFMIPYAIIGWDIVYKAIRNIFRGSVFDENFLMFIATVGAFVIGEYSEAVAVMLFYQIGELFQDYAVNRSRQSIAELMDICPEYANIELNGKIEQVDPDDVEVGTTIVVKAGERIPLDGIVTDGESMIDTSSLTGESVPRRVSTGSEVISGCVNGSGVLYVKTTKEFEDSTVAKILELVENASSKKAKVENFITRFARYYTPIVVICALILAFVPPIIVGGWGEWLKRACIFLVISCPCALVISVPLSFFGGIGAASKSGILVKGSNYLELVSKLDTVVFDKTGTLTKGEFAISKIVPEDNISSEELLRTAAYAEAFSNHPVAQSVKDAYEKKAGLINTTIVQNSEEIPGNGVKVELDGAVCIAGNDKLMKANNIEHRKVNETGTVVHVAKAGIYLGYILISDAIKPEAKEALLLLKQAGVKKTVMLTGDRKDVGEAVAKELGIDEVYTDLLPADKVSKVEELLKKCGDKGDKKLAFVGDGINDAPVLTRADVGIAMGSMGSDAAIEAADVVLMDDDTRKIAKVVSISRKTLRIVLQNIIFALAVKGFILILGAFGAANMWEAVFADVGVSVIAILNAMRVLRVK